MRLRVLLGTLFALLVVSIAASLGFGPATASAIYNYDAPAIARVCAHEMGRVEASQFQLSVVRDMSAPPSGEVRGASTTPHRPVVATEADLPQVLVNQANGNAARDAIASQYPGAQTEVSLQTDLGWRRIDVLTDQGLAIESKVGYTSLTSSIQTQIAKGMALMADPVSGVSAVQWNFSTSPVTGLSGPSGPLAAALTKAGITWVAP